MGEAWRGAGSLPPHNAPPNQTSCPTGFCPSPPCWGGGEILPPSPGPPSGSHRPPTHMWGRGEYSAARGRQVGEGAPKWGRGARKAPSPKEPRLNGGEGRRQEQRPHLRTLPLFPPCFSPPTRRSSSFPGGYTGGGGEKRPPPPFIVAPPPQGGSLGLQEGLPCPAVPPRTVPASPLPEQPPGARPSARPPRRPHTDNMAAAQGWAATAGPKARLAGSGSYSLSSAFLLRLSPPGRSSPRGLCASRLSALDSGRWSLLRGKR